MTGASPTVAALRAAFGPAVLRDEVVCGGSDGTPKIYQMYRVKKRIIGDDFNLIQNLQPLPGRVYTVKYSPDGSKVAAGSSADGTGEVRVFESASRSYWQLTGVTCVSTNLSRGLSIALLLPDMRYHGRQLANMSSDCW